MQNYIMAKSATDKWQDYGIHADGYYYNIDIVIW